MGPAVDVASWDLPISSASDKQIAVDSVLWQRFCQESIRWRVAKDKYEQLARQLLKEEPVQGANLMKYVLDCQIDGDLVADGLLCSYVETLLDLEALDLSHLLLGTYLRSYYIPQTANGGLQDPSQNVPGMPRNSVDMDTKMIVLAATRIISESVPKSPKEARAVLDALPKWLTAVSGSHNAVMHALDHQFALWAESVGILAISVLENRRFISIIDHASTKKARERLSDGLASFLPVWTQLLSHQAQPQSAERLAIAFKSRMVLEDKAHQPPDINLEVTAALQIDTIPNPPIVHARASMLIFLNSLMLARPITDDLMVINYLQMKYKINMQTDVESAVIDLVVGSFDLLAYAKARRESDLVMFAMKSFLINKIPILVSSLSASMYPPDRVEDCIVQAVSHVDPTLFPSPSFGLLHESVLQDVRQQFLFSCVLHSLLRRESVDTLLGEAPFSPPPEPSSRLAKDDLYQQCAADSERITELIEQLEKLDGNAGAISAVILQLVHDFCHNKDTMALKSICGLLSTKPRTLDVIIQFVPVTNLLQPLCHQLDTWRYEDDHDYQSAYVEFASVFLFVLVLIYRYDLSIMDLGISADSFVARFVNESHSAQHFGDIPADQAKKISVWFKALLNEDSIDDEILSAFKPQEFYLFLSTLVSQIFYASASSLISLEQLKTLLEYLIEPFLAPALVAVFEWMLNDAFRRKSDLKFTAQLLSKIFQVSSEKSGMYQTVVTIMSFTIDRFMRKLTGFSSKLPDWLENVKKNVGPHVDFRRTLYSPFKELQSLRASPGSLKIAFRSSIQSLIMWSVSASITPVQQPISYTPQTFYVSLLILGPRCILQTLLEEIKARASDTDGSAAVALDIAAAFVCSPVPGSAQSLPDWTHNGPSVRNGRGSLREVLRHRALEAPKLLATDHIMAESVVQLHRRVEALLQMTLNSMSGLSATLIPQLSDMDESTAAAVDLAAAAVVDMDFTSAGADLMVDAGMALDLSSSVVEATGMDILGSGVPDDDIFGDLLSADMTDIELIY